VRTFHRATNSHGPPSLPYPLAKRSISFFTVMSFVAAKWRASASIFLPISSFTEFRMPGKSCAKHLLLTLAIILAVAGPIERVPVLRDQPRGPNVRL
jgi:hypothetical protein